jgi:hypothetical protein
MSDQNGKATEGSTTPVTPRSYLSDEDLRDIERGSNQPSIANTGGWFACILILSISLIILVQSCKA